MCILGTKFQHRLTIFIFQNRFAQKGYFWSKGEKSNIWWILHTQFILGSTFQFRLKILIFWPTFASEGYFSLKKEKVNNAIAFCIFELVSVQNFSLSWQFFIFGPNFPKKGISGQKRNKWISPMNSTYLNQSRCPTSA